MGPIGPQYGLEGSTDVNKIVWRTVSIDPFDDDTGSSIVLVEDGEQRRSRLLSPIFQVAGRWFTGARLVEPETLSRTEPIRQRTCLTSGLGSSGF